MKQLKFHSKLKDRIIQGDKAVTWRFFDDKDLQKNDNLELIDAETGKIFAKAKILKIDVKKVKNTSPQELEENKYIDHSDVVDKNTAYYGRKINLDTEVKIIYFNVI